MSGAPERAGYMAGVAFIVLGGLVAAITGPLQFDRGSWLAAYLVLVCGMAQCVISHQRRLLGSASMPRARRWALFALWNVGNALIITGALGSTPLIADAGGVILASALVIAIAGTRHAQRRSRAALIRAVHVVLAVGIPIGLILTHLRAGSV